MTDNIALHKRPTQRFVTRHTRRYELMKELIARGATGMTVISVVSIDAYRQIQVTELLVQINKALCLGLISAHSAAGIELHIVRETENLSTTTLRATPAGIAEMPSQAEPAQELVKPNLPRRQRICGVQNPLDRPPLTRPGADDHRQHMSRSGACLAAYTPHP